MHARPDHMCGRLSAMPSSTPTGPASDQLVERFGRLTSDLDSDDALRNAWHSCDVARRSRDPHSQECWINLTDAMSWLEEAGDMGSYERPGASASLHTTADDVEVWAQAWLDHIAEHVPAATIAGWRRSWASLNA